MQGNNSLSENNDFHNSIELNFKEKECILDYSVLMENQKEFYTIYTEVMKQYNKKIDEEIKYFENLKSTNQINNDFMNLYNNGVKDLNEKEIMKQIDNYEISILTRDLLEKFTKKILNDNGIIHQDLFEKCQNHLIKENLITIQQKSNKTNIKIIQFDETRDYYYFGETVEEENEWIMEGFGFLSNKNKSEYYLGFFEDDCFSNGIWQRNSRELFIGEMFYNSDNIKVAFSGLIIKSRECTDKFAINHYILDLKFGEFYLDKNFYLGFSIHQSETGEIKVDYKFFLKSNNNADSKYINYCLNISRNIMNEFKYKKIYEIFKTDCKTLVKYFIQDNTSLINVIVKPNGEREYYAEYIMDNNNMILYRGEFKNLSSNYQIIKPNLTDAKSGILIDITNNIRFIGSILDGQIKNGKMNYTSIENNIRSEYSLEGNFINNEEKNKGQLFFGSIKKNNFLIAKDLTIIDKGIEYGHLFYEDKSTYRGYILNNDRNYVGEYIYMDNNENLSYHYYGGWKKGKREGVGKLTIKLNKDEFLEVSGEWMNNNVGKHYLIKNLRPNNEKENKYKSPYVFKRGFFEIATDIKIRNKHNFNNFEIKKFKMKNYHKYFN
jgi:hypothetical protein